jgi:hypothetical protein
MPIATTEYTPFNDLKASGVVTTDTFNTWRKKTNGLIVLLDGSLASSNLSAGAPSWTSAGATSIFGGSDVLSGDALTISANSAGSGLLITQRGAGPALRVNDVTSDATPLIVDENGHLIVGHTATLPVYNKFIASTISPHISTVGTTAALGASMSIYAATGDAQAGILAFAKSRGTIASPSVITTGDSLGVIDWQGHSGTNPLSAANIECISSGTVAAANVQGALLFSTRNPSGTLAERMRIDSAGLVGIGKTTPTVALDVNGAITSSGTITGATLTNGIVSISGGAISGLTSYSVTGNITATAKLKGDTLEVGSTAQLTVTNAGVLSTSGSITSTGGAVTGVGLSAGSGNITTTAGLIKSNGITINGNQLNAVPAQTLALAAASATDGSTTTAYNTIIYDGRGVAAVTVTGSSKAVTFAGALSGITTISASGAITGGSFNASSGGISNAGAITGATTISVSGAITAGGLITGVGLAAGTGTITTSSTITATGAITGGSFNASSGGISNAGAITGATTISASGAVTAGGLVTGVGLAAGGAITGATTISASGNITTTGGTVTANAFTTSGGTGAVTCTSIAATSSITVASSGTSGTLNVWDNTQTSFSTAGIVCNSTAGNSGIGLHCSGATAAYIEHTRGGSGIGIYNLTGDFANLKAAQIDATGDIIAFSTSDRKYKDNIANITNPLDKVAQINGVSFDWNDKQSTFTGRDIGVIAQEVEAVLPEVVTTRDDGSKAVKYDKMVALLIECVKELKAEIEELKSKVK